MPLLYPTSIEKNEVLLRRAHAVLAYLAQFYVHTQVPQFKVPVAIPAPVAVPLIEVSKQLDIAAILTYSDTTIYNWGPIDPNAPYSTENLRALCNFSGTIDEEHFYLTSARIELRGVEALEIMRVSMNEAFVADTLAKKRLGSYLEQLATVIDDMTTILVRVRESCDPATFYNQIRPWFRGGNSTDVGWTYEGVPESVSDWAGKLGGPSAGQSTLIHALDAFLGIDHSNPADKNSKRSDPTFVMRQRDYMPRHHRAFLVNLLATTQSVRAVVDQSLRSGSSSSNKLDAETNKKLQVSYDAAVISLKKFRDAHIRIATLYIVNQARKGSGRNVEEGLTGTGGTKLVPFLKEIRDNTAKTMVDPKSQRSGH